MFEIPVLISIAGSSNANLRDTQALAMLQMEFKAEPVLVLKGYPLNWECYEEENGLWCGRCESLGGTVIEADSYNDLLDEIAKFTAITAVIGQITP